MGYCHTLSPKGSPRVAQVSRWETGGALACWFGTPGFQRCTPTPRPLAGHHLWVAGLPSRCSLPTMQLRSLRPWRTPRDGPLPPPGRVSRSTSNPEGAGAAAVAQLRPREGAGRCGAARSLRLLGQHQRVARASARTALPGCSVSASRGRRAVGQPVGEEGQEGAATSGM